MGKTVRTLQRLAALLDSLEGTSAGEHTASTSALVESGNVAGAACELHESYQRHLDDTHVSARSLVGYARTGTLLMKMAQLVTLDTLFEEPCVRRAVRKGNNLLEGRR